MTPELAKKYRELAKRFSKGGHKIKPKQLIESALSRYYNIKMSEYEYSKWRKLIFEEIYYRDGGMCLWCHQYISKEDATLDHLIPIGRGGKKLAKENITICCQQCNNDKGMLLPEEYLYKLGFK